MLKKKLRTSKILRESREKELIRFSQDLNLLHNAQLWEQARCQQARWVSQLKLKEIQLDHPQISANEYLRTIRTIYEKNFKVWGNYE